MRAYLLPDRDDVDKLIIGSFVLWKRGFLIVAGTLCDSARLGTSLLVMQEEPAFSRSALDAFQGAGDTSYCNDGLMGSEGK